MLDRYKLAEHFDTKEEFLKFERVQNPTSGRPDLHAFALLDRLCPGTRDLVSCAEHDEIWLDVDLDALCSAATPEQAVELVRCGIRYDKSVDSLAMFV